MRVLAIDPGYERLGIAVLEKIKRGKETLIHSECFTTKRAEPDTERLRQIGEKIRETIKKWKPEALAIETLFLHSNQKTAMRVAEARGIILYEAVRAGLTIAEYSPLQIKMAVTGYGRADKQQVSEMIPRLISLPKKIRIDDELDAIAVGLTFFAVYRE